MLATTWPGTKLMFDVDGIALPRGYKVR